MYCVIVCCVLIVYCIMCINSVLIVYVKVKIAQLCLTLCNPMDYRVHGVLQTRILKRVAFPFLLQGIFLNQGLNKGLQHCRQIL